MGTVGRRGPPEALPTDLPEPRPPRWMWALLLLPGVLLLALPGALPAVPGPPILPSPKGAVVLYSGGLQGELAHCGCDGAQGGLARRRTVIRSLRRGPRPLFLLDTGDLVHRFPPGHRLRRPDADRREAWLLDHLSREGLDLLVPGPRDLTRGWGPFGRALGERSLAWVAADPPPGLSAEERPPSGRVLERGGFRLGVVGVAGLSERTGTGVGKEPGPPAPTAERVQEAVDRVRAQGIDCLLLLSSQGLSADGRMLAKLRGVDVVVAGRSGEVLRRPLVLHGVPVVQAGTRGKRLGCLDLLRIGEELEVRHRILELDQSVPDDPEVDREVRAYLEGPGKAKPSLASPRARTLE